MPIADSVDGGTTIASLTIPAGSYEVEATASLYGGSSNHFDCEIIDPAAFGIDASYLDVDTTIPDANLSMDTLDTTTGGTMTLHCNAITSGGTAYVIRLVAIQLSSATFTYGS